MQTTSCAPPREWKGIGSRHQSPSQSSEARGDDDSSRTKHLRDQSERLRLDLANARLDLALTAARIANQIDNSAAGDRFRRAALKSCKRTMHIFQDPGWSSIDWQALQAKLNLLREELENPGTADQVPCAVAVVAPNAQVEPLTSRERQVLALIAEGHSTKEVAAKLGITFKTAACHRYRMMDKLDLHATASLVRYAIRNGYIRV